MKLDPPLASHREDPEILALLAEPADGETKTAVAPKALSESAQLATRALALLTTTAFTRDDLGSAEELAKRATDTDPDNAAAWGGRACRPHGFSATGTGARAGAGKRRRWRTRHSR